MKYYPAFLNLKDRAAVVVGGGRVAERKARTLIRAGAVVKVISPVITAGLKKLADAGKISLIERNYRRGDLGEAFLVVAATSSVRTNTEAARHARHLVNVVDTPSEGNFIAPSIISRGALTVAISTEGASPAISKAIRKEIEKLYGPEFAKYLKFVKEARGKAAKKIADPEKREIFLKSLASKEALEAVRKKGLSAVFKNISASLEKLTSDYRHSRA
ncbi:MAG: bifunctional precorrin-2 dehydrogenase/sirohydrochlorin ferrochelatase [Nitrospirae bacterium]|nr:bifunctional precorrin-2 dehydrogenase/sirohydrochlorin ferrochelatase [Nitrospirota bacterium]